jgi:hypothetical protein
MVRDSRETTIVKQSDTHWILINKGKLRTYRIAANGLSPDMFECKGVTGFNSESNVMYIHTDGSPKVELILSAQPKRHPYLVRSSAEIGFQELSSDKIAFTVADLRPITVELGGLPANAELSVAINKEPRPVRSNAEGHLTLALPADASVTLPALLSAR